MGEEPIKEMKANKSESKTKEELDEDKLFIYKNNFVHEVIDKGQFGDYGLIHTVHELSMAQIQLVFCFLCWAVYLLFFCRLGIYLYCCLLLNFKLLH